MKHLKRFNENNENNDLSKLFQDLFKEEVEVRIPLEELLKETSFLILTKDGKIYQFENGQLQISWNSNDEFKEQTGASLDNEYAGNKSPEFLDYIKKLEYEFHPYSEHHADYYEIIDEIEAIYFEGEPSDLIKNLIN